MKTSASKAGAEYASQPSKKSALLADEKNEYTKYLQSSDFIELQIRAFQKGE